jgi:hypothetical protein
MTRILPKALALALAGALAGPAVAAEQPPAESKSFGSKEPDLAKKPTKKKTAPPPTEAQLQYRLIRTAKSAFMGAVGACTRPEMCDPKSTSRDPEAVKLVEKTERQFVDACEACATVEVCEEERAKIRAGTASFNKNPCYKKEPAAGDKAAKEAKAGGEAKGAAPRAAPDAAKTSKPETAK